MMSEYDKMHDYLKDQTFYDKFPEAWKVKKLYDKKVESLERQIKEDRRDHLKDTRELLRQLAEAREITNKFILLPCPFCGSKDIEKEKNKHLERQLEGIDLYIEAECHEAWVNNWEGREGAFVDMAKKLKQLKEKGDERNKTSKPKRHDLDC